MNNLTKMQVATYLTKSDKLLDKVTDEVYKVTCNPSLPKSDRESNWNYIRDILVGVIHSQLSTDMVTAETLFVQAKLILDCESDNPKIIKKGDIPKVLSEIFDLPTVGDVRSDIEFEKAQDRDETNYSRTYCSKHKCEDRDITDREDSDSDEFFCGMLGCGDRIPSDFKRSCQQETCVHYKPYPGGDICRKCIENTYAKNVVVPKSNYETDKVTNDQT